MTLKQNIISLAEEYGAVVGIAPTERMTSPPSANPAFLLAGARSVISLLMPLNGDIVRNYLAGKDQEAYTLHERAANDNIYTLAKQIASFLKSKGYHAIAVPNNYNYRNLTGKRHRNNNQVLLRVVMNWLTSPSGKIASALKRRLVNRFISPQINRQDWNLLPTFLIAMRQWQLV